MKILILNMEKVGDTIYPDCWFMANVQLKCSWWDIIFKRWKRNYYYQCYSRLGISWFVDTNCELKPIKDFSDLDLRLKEHFNLKCSNILAQERQLVFHNGEEH